MATRKIVSIIFICIVMQNLSAGSDWCEKALHLLAENDTITLREMINSERSDALECIESSLDSFIFHSVTASPAKAIEYKNNIIKMADIYQVQFGDIFYKHKADRIFSYPHSKLIRKHEIYLLKKAAISDFNRSDLRAAQKNLEQGLLLAQKINDQDDPANLNGILGAVYFYLGEFDSALTFYNESLRMLKAQNNLSRIADCLNNIANVYSDRSDYNTALEYFTKAKSIHEEINDRRGLAADQNNIGLVNEEMGNYTEALGHYQTALELNETIKNQTSSLKNLANMANIYINVSQYTKALELYQKVIPLRRELEDRKGEGNDYGNLGIIYDALGDYQTALVYFQKALKIHQDIGYKEGEAYQYGRLGGMYLKSGQYALATKMYQQAYNLHDSIGHLRGVAYWREALGMVYANIGDYDRAMDELNLALTVHREIENKSGEASCLGKIGHVYIDLENYSEAGKCFNIALQQHRKLAEKRSECLSLSDLGYLHYRQNNFTSGIEYCQQAYTLARQINDPGLLSWIQLQTGDLYRANGDLKLAHKAYEQGLALTEGLEIPEIRWQIYFGKGQIWAAQNDNERAYFAYRAAINTIEGIRGNAIIQEMKAGIIHDRFSAYESIILLLTEMGRYEEALSYLERSRARNMLDVLGNTRIIKTGSKSGNRGKEEQELRNRISELQTALLEAVVTGDLAERGLSEEFCRESLNKAQEEYHRLLVDLKVNDPEYYRMVVIEPLSLNQIQNILDQKTALLEYFITDDKLLIFIITRDQLHLLQIPQGAQAIRGKILLFRGTAVHKIDRDKLNSLSWVKPLHGLYQTLLQPVEQAGYLQNITNLIISPQGQLHYLPFQTLITHYDVIGTENIRPFFLVEKYDISYSPSASMLQFYRYHTQKMDQKILLLAPNIARLPESAKEVENVARNFGKNADLYLNEQATESLIKKSGKNYDFLHFATTAHFNQNNPLFSRIDLHECPLEDGSLEVNEIFSLDLQARLTILSACQTALGAGYSTQLPNGEDLISLTQAFLYAGSSSVIASLWEIEDPATAEFMPRFYENAKKLTTATALAKTQREFIRGQGGLQQGLYFHPYYWAAFILVGNWQ